ncbi:MAG: cyclophilin-like fold protein [bacterium]
MKMRILAFFTAVILSAALPGCSSRVPEKQEPAETAADAAAAEEERAGETIEEEEEDTEREEKEETAAAETTENEEEETMKMTIGDAQVNVAWENNDSVRALMDLCREKPLVVEMSMYGGFEQVGGLGKRLPSNDTYTTTSSGDIVLYSSNQIVVFYGSNSWEYTRLGHITDRDQAGMSSLLSGGDVTITISMEE